MTRTRTRCLVAVLALAMLLPSTANAEDPTPSPYGLADRPPPNVTGAQLVAMLSDFVETYPYRITGTPMEILAGQSIADDMTALGYQTNIRSLPVRAGVPVATPPLKAITAFKQGTTRADEVLLFIGHYDTVAQTVQGAYDNGSGTTLLRGLARALANVETSRSIMFAWYNGEEEGVLASSQHAQALRDEGVNVKAVFGFDMVGISYPVANPGPNNCLCMWHGADDAWLAPVLEAVNFDFLQLPNSLTQVRVVGNNNRNSDESSFESRGFHTLRWAGMRTAGSYPAYHKSDDTLATIDTVAGGRTYFEQGYENTLRSAYYTALALDSLDNIDAP